MTIHPRVSFFFWVLLNMCCECVPGAVRRGEAAVYAWEGLPLRNAGELPDMLCSGGARGAAGGDGEIGHVSRDQVEKARIETLKGGLRC